LNLRADNLDALYRAHAPSVFRRARRMLGSDADAHEIVSEVFLSLCERPEQYAGQSSLSTFLHRMVTNACLNRLRIQKNRARLLASDAAEAMHDSSRPPIAPDRALQLRHLLGSLPEELSQVAVYYYLDELTQEETAELMGCSRRQIGKLLERLQAWVRSDSSVPS
jgi:RNA polymerase sigma factor (sigma-70 family)